MNFRYFLPLILTICSLQSLQAQKKYTLQECVDIALENNRNIKQQALNKQQKEVAYSQARTDLLPNLNASMGQSFVYGRSIGIDNTYQNINSSQSSFNISSDITLFDGLKMKYNIDARKAEMYISEADLEKIQDDIIMSVSTAFMQVLMNKELLEIANDQIELTEINIRRLNELVKSGKMAKGELLELEAQQAQEEFNQIQAVNNLKLSLLDLAQIMELEDFENFDVEVPENIMIDEGILLSPTNIYESALIARPEIRGAQYRVESSEKEIMIAKSAYFPSLSFGASMGSGYYNMSGRPNESFGTQLKNNRSTSLGFSLRIPIFNRFQVRNSVKNAQYALEYSKLEIDKTKLDLRKRIEQAYYNAIGAESRWEAAQKSEIASQEAYRFAEQKYENGRATSYELSQAKTNLAKVLADQAQAKYEYVFRLKILELLKD
ncbi:MAG: TolC family protein [Dysgonamonadaceae bacterium]|nr:TolC family protein [Dysgonamonadaceae bacterium]MDD3356452.1 TolC family protein [Dysgonamonadaceae bacterium]MDD3727533.1 TolC family protein [Dysgonamonadaceae bacterium]MDD4246540.1 TolC family protein [Dysgonamonadaceae bacterium]MDD4605506.1 TolC family protein [Dysgonamonadaceae bacterium]